MSYRLKDFGSFHVGGRKVVLRDAPPISFRYTPSLPATEKDPNGEYCIDQAYVQYFIPENTGGRLPVVFLHGGGLTGVTWETTPDGRPGWLHHFLARGFPCYVVDQPERGRSGFSVVADTWEGDPVARTSEEAWYLFRFGALDGFATRTPYAGCDFPVDAIDAFAMQAVPRWHTTRGIHIRAFADVLDRVGLCTVVCHSQGGDTAHQVVIERADTVRNVVAVEPSGFAPDLSHHRLAGQRYLYVYGDYLERHPMWDNLEPLAADNITRLEVAGADVTRYDLADHGLPGATHMLMMDRANAKSANLVMEWIDADLDRARA